MSIQVKHCLLLLFFASTTYYIGSEMKKRMDSKQVIQFEFLRTEANTDARINTAEWQSLDADGRNSSDRLRCATHWDFLYIISYVGLFIFLAYTVLGSNRQGVKTMSLLLIMAGLSDVIENVFLLQILSGGRGWYPAAMFCFASLKFGLLALFVIWLLIAAGQCLRRKRA